MSLHVSSFQRDFAGRESCRVDHTSYNFYTQETKSEERGNQFVKRDGEEEERGAQDGLREWRRGKV